MSKQDNIKLTIDGNEVEVPKGAALIEACEVAGVEVPRFCYHKRLKVAGNCRMCLVEVEGGPPKPTASCAFPAGEGMVIHTNSPMVKKAREGVMEFLLINHPLDCPICDQGGECDLQDQAMAYGRCTDRYDENKRSVAEKDMGPLIKTEMTRCIHCTRCVRFMEDIAGTEILGAIGRGEHMEVTTYLDNSLTSELSGNIIDLCPVGALTSKPYAFKARSWELEKTNSIDVLDAVGSNIRVDSRGGEVMRIQPRVNEDINEEWISDKTRFSCDGLKSQRLDKPYIRVNGKLIAASWDEAYQAIADKVKNLDGSKIAAIAGDLADVESMLVLKKFMRGLGSANIDCRQDGVKLGADARASYLFNTTIAGIEKADACLIIGGNPRYDAPILNARIRKRHLAGGFEIATIGVRDNLNYKVNNLGKDIDIIEKILSGKEGFSKVLKKAKCPMVILGYDALTRPDGAAILHKVRELCDKYGVVTKDWNGFNVLHKAASRVGGLDIGFVPGDGGKNTENILKSAKKSKKADIEVVYLLGADEVDMSALENTFVIYQGHHGDAGAHAADVILPGAAYTEKNATYVNLEGRVQQAVAAINPPGEAREDWQIIKQLAAVCKVNIPYSGLQNLRAAMARVAPHFANIGEVNPAPWVDFGEKSEIDDAPMNTHTGNFYMTNSISRASKTMAQCSEELWNKSCGCKNKEVA